MTFLFHAKESCAHAVRRLGSQRIDHAIAALAEAPRSEKAVHDARKSIKKARAIIRLVEDGLEGVGRLDRRLGRVARQLGAPRDALVLIQRFADLQRGHRLGAAGDRLAEAFAQQRVATETALQAALPQMLEALAEVRRRVKRCDPSGGWALAWRGIERVYADAAKAHRRAQRSRKATDLHRWRRRLKEQWYAIRLLVPAWPEALQPLNQELSRLSDTLGLNHDLHVLGTEIRRRETDRDRKRTLLRSLGVRRESTSAEALRHGERLYAEDPAAYARRLHRYWRLWRDEAP
ncbi:MAG: CHAD domain-containing protein [Planctomycetes bacterium]|nr:CHAD domain-containing protein [Planctomycetota bacterium]